MKVFLGQLSGTCFTCLAFVAGYLHNPVGFLFIVPACLFAFIAFEQEK